MVEALLALYREGQVHPSIEVIARRAGVSSRSVFRYFDDTDDLAQAAVARQAEANADRWEHVVDPTLPFAERLQRFVEWRIALLVAIGSVGLVARVHAPVHPVIQARLSANRARLRDQIATAFEPELAPLAPSERVLRLATLDVVCSWEAHWLMTTDQGLDNDTATTAMRDAIDRLLSDEVAR